MNISKKCLFCNKPLGDKKRNIYCSNKCQKDLEYKKYIENWLNGLVDGNRGTNTRNISQHLKRYLVSLYGEKCILCGWNQRNVTTGRVPLEIDHINGDSEDNEENNLRLICPNCHSLGSNFRNLNKGKGRSWRTLKYIKQIS